MESLSLIAFFGVLLIDADSYRTELIMCIMTVFGISAFAFVLSDLDYAFHGTFCVDLTVFSEFLHVIDYDYKHLKHQQELPVDCDDVTGKGDGVNSIEKQLKVISNGIKHPQGTQTVDDVTNISELHEGSKSIENGSDDVKEHSSSVEIQVDTKL